LRSIRNPKAKQDLLVHLLENAPVNMELSADFDEILRGYQSVSTKRNKLVHAKWFTSDAPGSPVFVSEASKDGMDFLNAKAIDTERLNSLAEEICRLKVWIVQISRPILAQRRQAIATL
jgi:hypothetical protein